MGTCEDITLLELFDQYMNTHQAVCVKNIPVKASKDSLLNFVEVILKTEVIAIYSPLSDTAKCVVVVLEKPIKDLTLFTRALEERKLEGNVIALTKLGQAEGLFIRGVPKDASDEFLKVYFESSGRPRCVSEVKSYKCCLDRMVVVFIKDTSVVRKILDKRPHPSIDKYDLKLEPYFPPLHEDLLKNHSGKSVAVSDPLYARGKVRPHASCENPKDQHKNIKPARLDRTYNNKAGEIDQKVRQEKKSVSSPHPEDRASRTSTLSKIKIFTDNQDSVTSVETETDFAVEQPKNTKLTRDSIPINSQNSDRLRQTYANAQESVYQTKNRITPIDDHDREATYSAQDPVTGDLSVGKKDEREHGKKKARNPVGRSRPGLDMMEDYFDTESSDATFLKQASPQKGFHMEPKKLDLDSKAGVAVGLEKPYIILLKIYGFTKRCGNCKVTLVEEHGLVQFEGDADAINQSNIRMNKILQDVEEVTRRMPKHHVQYISKSEGYLRNQFTKKRIGAVIVSNVEEATVCSMAFTTQKAENGLEFIMKELVSKPLTLRKGQSQYFEGTEWRHVLNDLEKNVQVTVFKEDKNVDIVAFNEPSVKAARQKIIGFLKESQLKGPKARTEERLQGASARYFSH